MTQTLTVALTETEMKLLKKSAALDCRRPQEQARYIMREVLLKDSRLQDLNNNSEDLQEQP